VHTISFTASSAHLSKIIGAAAWSVLQWEVSAADFPILMAPSNTTSNARSRLIPLTAARFGEKVRTAAGPMTVPHHPSSSLLYRHWRWPGAILVLQKLRILGGAKRKRRVIQTVLGGSDGSLWVGVEGQRQWSGRGGACWPGAAAVYGLGVLRRSKKKGTRGEELSRVIASQWG
jgi:hypothetical protein